MKKISIIGFLLILGIMIISCSQSTSTGGSTGGKGEIRGSVNLFDTDGMQIFGISGVKVSAENDLRDSVTQFPGNLFDLKNLPDGIIPLVFSKEGFAELHDFGTISTINHFGDYGIASLYQISHCTPDIVLRPFEDCYIYDNFRDTEIYSAAAGGYLHLWIYDSLYETNGLAQFSSRILDPPNYQGAYKASVRLYFSSRDSIVPSDPSSFQFASDQTVVDPVSGSGTISIYRDSLFKKGLASSMKIYCVAFASGRLTQSQFYYDKSTGKKIYTGLSPFHSDIRSFQFQ
jgi:hypothetical protein